jgi:putative ABC transport system permease protein
VRLTLAAASLVRHRARTLLAVAGVAVSAALLLDMVMLASGMQESFRDLLLVRGYQLRVTPKGTLPFDSEATVEGASAVAAALRRDPRVTAVSPVLGGQLFVVAAGARRAGDAGPLATALGFGVLPAVQGDYELLRGADVAAAPAGAAGVDRLVASDAFLRAAGVRVGDTVEVAAGFDPQLRQYAGRRRLAVAGVGRFFYTEGDQAVAALPLAALQAMRGDEGRDRASAFMARVADGADVEAVRAAIERRLPRVSVISTATALAQVEQRLSYFRQLAFILGAVSLAVGFLLVTTLVTVGVNERAGEFAVLRAVGVSRPHVVEQVMLEGLALSGAGALAGLVLGLATARYLNGVLGDFPGLPADFAFFVFRPGAAWRALGLLVASGVLAGAYPAWRAASLPVARTLREEGVG